MKKIDLTRRLARQTKLSQAAAADRLDRVIHRILKELKKGKPVSLPGLGTFKPDRKNEVRFVPAESRRSGRAEQ
jgi:nucleoid DNA-binding protein